MDMIIDIPDETSEYLNYNIHKTIINPIICEYDEMLLKRRVSLEEEYQEGDIGPNEYDAQKQELADYHSLADRMVAAVRADAIAKGKPENEASIFVHPFISFSQQVAKIPRPMSVKIVSRCHSILIV